MQSDLPHTLYKRSGKAGAKPGKAPVRKGDPAFEMQRKAYEKKLARLKAQSEGEAPYTMEEIFR